MSRLGVSRILGLMAAINLLASVALAQPAPPGSARERENADRWIPSVALEGGISFQKFDASVASQICRGCMLPDPLLQEELQPGGPGDDRDSTALIGIQLELLSPELSLPGSPRVFISGEIAPTFGNERNIVVRGTPGPVGSPSDNPIVPFGETLATGQGSVITMKRDELSFGASLGLAFPVEFMGRQFQIRPSVNWTRFDVELDGLVSDAECLDVVVANFATTRCNSPPQPPAGFLRVTQIRTSTDETFDGIGPGLHVEMEAARLGPLGAVIFGGARFYRLLGEKDVQIRGAPITTSDVLGTDQSAAQFGFEVDEWLYRFGIGVRLQWLGDDRPQRR